jgi:iron(III) transport system substrate-binding protein
MYDKAHVMHTKQMKKSLLITVSLLTLSSLLSAAEPLIIYSHRHYEADEKLFETFTDKTGIEVQVIKAGASELLQRLKSEGDRSPADILITADAGRLGEAKAAGLLAPVASEFLTERIPEAYRDTDNHWFGFTLRARVLVYAPDRVNPEELSTYADLTQPKWKGRFLSRSSSNIYNQSLLSAMIETEGEKQAMAWATQARKNMARPPQGSDRDQIRAVASGIGDVALVNTYYVGLLLNSPDPKDQSVAKQVKIFFPNQEQRGTHVNVSGAAILKTSTQKEDALKFLEFLASDEAQKSFPQATYEYPVVKGIPWSDLQKEWGTFKTDPLNLSILAEHNRQAVKLFNLAGWE